MSSFRKTPQISDSPRHKMFVPAPVIVDLVDTPPFAMLYVEEASICWAMNQGIQMMGKVIAVSVSGKHLFSKTNCDIVRLIAGLGVEGDAHMGETVQHRSRVAENPNQPNLRQVHLIHTELFDELALQGFVVLPGQMGENITTQGIDLLALPRDTVLRIGETVAIQITGLRNPCAQVDAFLPGLRAAVLEKDDEGRLIRKAGIMGIVLMGGEVGINDAITTKLPPLPHLKLDRV